MADNVVTNSGATAPTTAPSSPLASASFPSLNGGGAAPAPKNLDFILH